MKIVAVLAIALAFSPLLQPPLAAGPSSRPATQPTDNLEASRAALAQADAALAKARAEAVERCHNSDAYRASAADRDAKEKLLEIARREASPQGRLDASSAFGKANAVVKKIEQDALASDRELAAVVSEDNRARSNFTRAQILAGKTAAAEAAAEKAAKDNDPITKAIQEGRVIVGMTEAQGLEALHNDVKQRYHFHNPVVITPTPLERDGIKIIEWRCVGIPYSSAPNFWVGTTTVEVSDGKITHVTIERHEPEPRFRTRVISP